LRANVGYRSGDGGRRQSDGFDVSLDRGIFGPTRFRLCKLRLRYRQLGWYSFRCVEGSLRKRRCALFSKALKRFPDTLRCRLPVGKLGDRFHASEAVPDLDQPLVVGPDQVGELFFSGKDTRARSRAALREAWTVMLLSVSMVNVFM
jgi:hypothetical protein